MAQIIPVLKKQIEYYFSDENLQFDSFFQSKIKENDGWLPVDLILSCKKVQNLGATEPQVLEALKDSVLETKNDTGKSWIKRKDPLPELKSRPVRNDNKQRKSPEEEHASGVVAQITGIPAEITWNEVKDVVKRVITEARSDLTEENVIKFAGQVSNDGSMYLLFKPFDNAVDTVTKLDLEIANQKVHVKLLAGRDMKRAIDTMPKAIQEYRRRQQFKSAAPKSRAIKVAEIKFNSVVELKARTKQILNKTENGECLAPESVEYKIIKSVLEYHPRYDEKTKGMTGIKVDKFHKGSMETKCFFIVKEGGVTEDFSLNKCVDALGANPPYLGINGHVVSQKRKADEPESSSPMNKKAKTEDVEDVQEENA